MEDEQLDKQALAPSKSTVYIGNFSYSLTTSDLHKVFEKVGKVVRVSIVKDRKTRKSTGIGFVLFLRPEDAQKCVEEFNNTELFGRRLKCNIAKDNGRCAEFIRKRKYPDKSRCYECGAINDHLSYKCPKNILGQRDIPRSSKKKKRDKCPSSGHTDNNQGQNGFETDTESETEQEEDESLGAAIRWQQAKVEEDEYRQKVATGNYSKAIPTPSASTKKSRIVKDTYFSDDEVEVVEEDN